MKGRWCPRQNLNIQDTFLPNQDFCHCFLYLELADVSLSDLLKKKKISSGHIPSMSKPLQELIIIFKIKYKVSTVYGIWSQMALFSRIRFAQAA